MNDDENYYITRDDLLGILGPLIDGMRQMAYNDACQAIVPAAVKVSAEVAMRVSGDLVPSVAGTALEAMVRAAVDEAVRAQPITVNVSPIVEAVMPPRATVTKVERDRRGLITKTTAIEDDV